VDADAKFDPPIHKNAGIALDEAVLHFDRAAHGVDDTAEFDEAAVAGGLTIRPWCASMAGSIRSLRNPLSRDRVRSSSAPASRL